VVVEKLEPLEPLLETCPRCGLVQPMRFWGPCDACRVELRATQGGAQRNIVVAAYEPKMNVTPNAVALKE
jgi:hypothetical protein